MVVVVVIFIGSGDRRRKKRRTKHNTEGIEDNTSVTGLSFYNNNTGQMSGCQCFGFKTGSIRYKLTY